MMSYKYGEFDSNQIAITKDKIRKQIFHLLLYVDPNTKDQYPDINVNWAFECLLKKIGGLNSIFNYPPEIVAITCLLEAALMEYNSSTFEFSVYRKLVLDAGAEVLNIKEV